ACAAIRQGPAVASTPARRRRRQAAGPAVTMAVAAAVPRGLLVAAAGELGDDPAGGEGGAEGGDRALADQVGGAVDQVAALVQQLVDLLAARTRGFFERGQAGDRAVGEVGLQVGLAQAHFLARG